MRLHPVRVLVLGLLAVVVPQARAGAQATPRTAPSADVLARVVLEIERLDAMRSSLARTFAAGGVAATDSTFAQVCKPVKAQSMKLATENGWMVAQLAEKNRNPDNTLDAGARRIFAQMQRDPSVMGEWVRTSFRGKEGVRYFRRIVVEPSCLACHGDREKRPDFVKKQYPRDRAFGFSVGDLRGIYSVFLPHEDPSPR